jgi:PilZ domain-containing protein
LSGSERRKSPRHAVDLPVRCTASGRTFPGHLKDICRDAALVESHELCPLETRVVISMELPGYDGAVEIGGRVIRLAAGEGDARGMAILFTDLSPAAATRIDFFLAGLD